MFLFSSFKKNLNRLSAYKTKPYLFNAIKKTVQPMLVWTIKISLTTGLKLLIA